MDEVICHLHGVARIMFNQLYGDEMEEVSRLDFHLGKLIWEGKMIPYVVTEMTKRSKG